MSKPKQPRLTPADYAAMCAVLVSDNPHDRRLKALGDDESPKDLKAIFARVRKYRTHWFVGAILGLRQFFYHYGFQLVAADPVNQPALDKWFGLDKNRAKNVALYARDLWAEWLANDAAVSFWMKGAIRPTLLNLEEIEYRDEFGQEVLTITHGLTDARIKEMDLSPEVKVKLQQSKTIKIKADDDLFHFEVLKREQVGRGLGTPLLFGCFLALSAGDSLESHDAVLANTMRRVYEQHKLGHETRYGPNAGGASNFIKKARQDAVKAATRGVVGAQQITTNFDHEITYPGVDAKRFEASRYDGMIKRLGWWATPLLQLLSGQGQQPELIKLFRTQAIEERKQVAMHLELAAEAFSFPCQVTAQWSNDCFRDERIFSELLKIGLASGPVSQTTFLEAIQLKPDTERENKAKEATLPKEQTMPLFDAAHGINPAKPGGVNGRPAGSGDRYARNGEGIRDQESGGSE